MKTLRLIATPVILLALLGVLIWGSFWGWRELTAPFPTPSPTPCVTRPLETLKPKNIRVNVMNGGFTTGLATREANRLKEAGFQVLKTTNTEESIRGTVIRGNKSQNPEMLAMTASYFKDATIEDDGRVNGTIDVLLGTDFQGEGAKPKKKMKVESGEVCVPAPEPSVSPTPSPEPSKEP